MTIEEINKRIDSLTNQVKHLYRLLNIKFECNHQYVINLMCADCRRDLFEVKEDRNDN